MGNGPAKAPAMDAATKAFYDKLQGLLGATSAGGSNAALFGGPSVPQGASAPDPQLYLGSMEGLTRGYAGGTQKFGQQGGENITGPNVQHGKVPDITTLSQAQMQWFHWTQAQRVAWASYCYAKGDPRVSNPTDTTGAYAVWNDSLDMAVRYYAAGNKTISPWMVVDMATGGNSDTLKKRAMIGADGTITHTNSQINLMDKGHVAALATQVLQQALGRDPTQSEINTYYNTIRGEQASHPTVTTSRTDAATGEQVGTATTSGGFDETDAAQQLKQQIQNDPEYAKFQSGTTYFQAAMSALGAIGGA